MHTHVVQTALEQRRSGHDLELSTDESQYTFYLLLKYHIYWYYIGIEIQEIRENLHIQYEVEQTLKAKINELQKQVESTKQGRCVYCIS